MGASGELIPDKHPTKKKDREACFRAILPLTDLTHVAYTAVKEADGGLGNASRAWTGRGDGISFGQNFSFSYSKFQAD